MFTFVKYVICQIAELRTLEDNSQFTSLISNIQMPTMQRGKISIAGYGEFDTQAKDIRNEQISGAVIVDQFRDEV